MNVNKTNKIDSEHSIEIGDSTWNSGEISIRRRKDTNGKFDVHSSSEIPINGYLNISDLYIECLKYDLITNSAMTEVLNQILASIGRKQSKLTIV